MGCAGFGITSADPFEDVATTIEQRQRAGHAGKLKFTYKDPEAATNIRLTYPWAQRLVVVSWSYMPAAGNPGPGAATTGRIARFAADDHYTGLKALLASVRSLLQDHGWQAETVVDDGRLVDRAAAVRAGVGWWGKSTMVLDPRHGPWLLLGSVVTDAQLPVTEPMVRDCGSCDACIPACPTGAIVAPGILDASLCIAHWTQMAGSIPRNLRRAMGDRVYGCDDCLDVCPPGIKRIPTERKQIGRVELLELLAAPDNVLRDRYPHLYLPRRDPRFLRRNAIVALGNSVADGIAADAAGGSDIQRTIQVLAGYLGDPDHLYRLHAAWALGRIVHPAVPVLLRHRLQSEQHEEVLTEIRATLAEIGSMGR